MTSGDGIRPATEREDTIAACATPAGLSGIAVIRVSGGNAIASVARHFSGTHDLAAAPSHTVHRGYFAGSDGGPLDEVLVTVFRAPHSYTGEDSMEISCHGGNVSAQAILRSLCAGELRHALPGEFTRRAFLNGRIDLAQAEAIADVIHAQSDDAHAAAVRQLQGKLSAYVGAIRERVLHCAAMLELSLDFAEEEVELLSREQMTSELREARGAMQEALDTYRTGRVLREGVKTVLVGAPNTGKSSLLNRLLGTRRAIVTDVPGTTRDYIEEAALLDGRLFRFYDTAGLRNTEDAVEREGIALSEEHIRSADIVCVLRDAGAEAPGDPAPHRSTGITEGMPGDRTITVLNKIDLAADDRRSQWLLAHPGIIAVSALTGEGMPAFVRTLCLRAGAMTTSSPGQDVMVTNARHADCLRRGLSAVDRAITAAGENRAEEFVAFDLRQAIAALDEIIGVVTTEDILHSIFSRFCIGK
jgi:tRNA modification GTPase